MYFRDHRFPFLFYFFIWLGNYFHNVVLKLAIKLFCISFIFRRLTSLQSFHSFMESHCVKSVLIRSFSDLFFPVFGLTTDQKTFEYGHFSRCFGVYSFIFANFHPFMSLSQNVPTKLEVIPFPMEVVKRRRYNSEN